MKSVVSLSIQHGLMGKLELRLMSALAAGRRLEKPGLGGENGHEVTGFLSNRGHEWKKVCQTGSEILKKRAKTLGNGVRIVRIGQRIAQRRVLEQV
jgi:hypothetical protein